jgi:DNA-binding NarL/FixJ family response regulator
MTSMLKVLIADDSDMVRERLRDLISEVEGTEVVGEAASGHQALEAVGRLEPDVLILDIRMPGGNGIEVLRALKENDVSPVVITLTAYAYPQYRRRCLEDGAAYFFDKGTEFERVVEVLECLAYGGGGAVLGLPVRAAKT